MSNQQTSGVRRLWSALVGREMSERFTRLLMPPLVWNQEILGRVLSQYVAGGTRWLEAGCGRRLLGHGLEKMEHTLMLKSPLIVGVDLALDALESHQTLRWRTCANLDQLPFGDGSFNLVTCNMVVEHLPDPSTSFRELARVLSPGGVMIIHTPNILNCAVFAMFVLKKLLPRPVIVKLIHWSDRRAEKDIFPTFYRANSRKKLQRLLDGLGLSEEICYMLVGPQPILKFLAPVAAAELLVMRATMLRALRPLRTTILGVYRKSGSQEATLETHLEDELCVASPGS